MRRARRDAAAPQPAAAVREAGTPGRSVASAGRSRCALLAATSVAAPRLAGLGAALLALAVSVAQPYARADSGLVRAREVAGPFAITLFSSPTPLRVGAADLSVLVQQAADDVPVLDAAVRLRLDPPAGSSARPIEVDATAALATNKLLYAAPVELSAPGEWRVRVAVARGDAAAEIAAQLPVADTEPPLARLWPWLAAPPAATALFALHQWLVRRTTTPALRAR